MSCYNTVINLYINSCCDCIMAYGYLGCLVFYVLCHFVLTNAGLLYFWVTVPFLWTLAIKYILKNSLLYMHIFSNLIMVLSLFTILHLHFILMKKILSYHNCFTVKLWSSTAVNVLSWFWSVSNVFVLNWIMHFIILYIKRELTLDAFLKSC